MTVSACTACTTPYSVVCAGKAMGLCMLQAALHDPCIATLQSVYGVHGSIGGRTVTLGSRSIQLQGTDYSVLGPYAEYIRVK